MVQETKLHMCFFFVEIEIRRIPSIITSTEYINVSFLLLQSRNKRRKRLGYCTRMYYIELFIYDDIKTWCHLNAKNSNLILHRIKVPFVGDLFVSYKCVHKLRPHLGCQALLWSSTFLIKRLRQTFLVNMTK